MEGPRLAVFVTTPLGATHTVRNLTRFTKLCTFKTRLELLTGFPSSIYSLQYGHTIISENEKLLFSGDIQTNTVLRICVEQHLEELVVGIKSSDVSKVLSAVQSEEDGAGIDTGKAFIAACLCAHTGFQAAVNLLLEKDPAILAARTINGRTLAHIATAGDRSKILFDLLMSSARNNIDLLVPDHLEQTPTDVAREYSAVISERMIRDFIHRKRLGTLGAFIQSNGEGKENKPKSSHKKTRAKSAQPRFSSRLKYVSSADSNSKSNLVSETASSGYHTQDNLEDLSPEPPYERTNKYTQSVTSERAKTSSPKRVKFQTRVKSAPAIQQRHEVKANDDRAAHLKCYNGKRFMAYRSVPEDELRPLAVEFVEMDRTNILGMDQRSREKQVQDLLQERSVTSPYSSLSNSIQDLTDLESLDDQSMPQKSLRSSSRGDNSPDPYTWKQTRAFTNSKEEENFKRMELKKELQGRYTRPATVTKRAQSAKYYTASHHTRTQVEEYHKTIPPPRPERANSRYRSWKPWLLEQYERDRARDLSNNLPERLARRRQSTWAFQEWLKEKGHSLTYEDRESSDESSEEGEGHDFIEASKNTAWAQAYYAAFKTDQDLTFDKWLQNKSKMFKEMDRKTLLHRRGETDKATKPIGLDRRVTIYEIGSTDDTPMKIDDPETYMHAFQKWKRRKAKYEQWKKNQGMEQENTSSYKLSDMDCMRRELYLDGYGHNEWLGQADRQDKVTNIHNKKVKFHPQ